MLATRSSATLRVHSNGFSLVRKILNVNKDTLAVRYDELSCTLGEELLKPTKIYVPAVQKLSRKVRIKALSHITGGGFFENIPRMLPAGVRASIDTHSFPSLIFEIIQKRGKIPSRNVQHFQHGFGP